MPTRYDRLPEAQRRLLPALAPLRKLGFVLYGGTAIALQLGHRVSIDFDFFSDQVVDRRTLLDAIPFLDFATTLQEDRNTWTVQTDLGESGDRPVKVSFFLGLRFGRVGQPLTADAEDVSLASLDDLLGHKLKVILQRAEAKDYQDIAAILRSGLNLEQGLGAAMALFPKMQPSEALKALVFFDDGDLKSLPDVDRATLIAHVDRFSSPVAMPILSNRLMERMV